VTVLAAIVTTPPKSLPTEVYQEMKAAEQSWCGPVRGSRSAASPGVVRVLPLVAWMGFSASHTWPALVLVPFGNRRAPCVDRVARAAHPVLDPARDESRRSIIGGAATTTLYGPVILAPTLIRTFTIVLASAPAGA
jgi:hypothetical protein